MTLSLVKIGRTVYNKKEKKKKKKKKKKKGRIIMDGYILVK